MKTGAALAGLVLFGCAMGVNRTYVHQDLREGDPLIVAVLPFENLSNSPTAGLSVSQLFATELMANQGFCVLEESEMRRQLIGLKVDMDRLADITIARDVGRGLFVDAVLGGSVSEFSYQHGLREEPAVGFNMQLVRIEDGVVLWRASQSLMGSGFLSRESIYYTAQKAVHDTVSQASELWTDLDRLAMFGITQSDLPTEPGSVAVARPGGEVKTYADRVRQEFVFPEGPPDPEELWMNQQSRQCATLFKKRALAMKKADEVNKAREREAKAREEAEKMAARQKDAGNKVDGKRVEDDLLEMQLPPK
ncbi:MAG: hypothetical protein HQL76_04240 [Magnetococcales bacterium]|nr:hypothetical protein [Magnetococcales bacterium]